MLRTNSNSTKNNKTGDPENNERRKKEEPQNRKSETFNICCLCKYSCLYLCIYMIRIYICIQTMLACYSSVFAKYIRMPSKTKTMKEIHTLARDIGK